MYRNIASLYQRRFLLATLVQRELRIRYKDSALGMLWMFGAPVLMIATYSFFVMGFLKAGSTDGVGLLPQLAGLWLCLGFWQWLSESVNRSTTVFHDNAQLVKRMPLPLGLLPLANILVSAISFLVPLFAASVCILAAGFGVSHILSGLAGVVILLPWVFGLSLLASVGGTYVKDAKHAIPLIMNVGMFLSPVLYSLDHAPAVIQKVMLFNPLAPGLSMLRSFTGASTFSFFAYTVSVVASIIFAVVSVWFFNARKRDFYDVV